MYDVPLVYDVPQVGLIPESLTIQIDCKRQFCNPADSANPEYHVYQVFRTDESIARHGSDLTKLRMGLQSLLRDRPGP